MIPWLEMSHTRGCCGRTKHLASHLVGCHQQRHCPQQGMAGGFAGWIRARAVPDSHKEEQSWDGPVTLGEPLPGSGFHSSSSH